MEMKNVFFCVLAIISIVIGHDFAQIDPKRFLFKYGYLEEESVNPTPEEWQAAISEFQSFHQLATTGVLDRPTIQKMDSPRCGVEDIIKQNRRVADYKVFGKWSKNLITWRINKFSTKSGLGQAEQTRAMSRSFDRWSEVSPLVFRETRGKSDIIISFDKKDDNDGYPFNHPLAGMLSYSSHTSKGDMHFNDEVNWVIGNYDGYDLETVATHEIGHVLGLSFSSNPSASMYPYYQKKPDNFKLHPDDIARIQAIYGKKHTQVTPRSTKPTTITNTMPKWPKVFTWKINKYSKTSRLSHSEQKVAIRRGFHRWSEVAQLIFIEAKSKADINISFDNEEELIGGIFAYTTHLPKTDIHFSDKVNWVIGNHNGVDLETVAAHEIGHALGLDHSDNPFALMYPYIQREPVNFKLHTEDIDRIQAIYGVRDAGREITKITPESTTPRNGKEKATGKDHAVLRLQKQLPLFL